MIQKLLSATTAAWPTGLPPQNRLFRVQSGPFEGRLVAFFARTPSTLSWTRSDPPYTTWSAPTDFITDAADLPFSVHMDDNADVYIVFTQQTTQALRCIKLVFANGTWVNQSPVTVYDSGTSANSHPSILRDLYDRIWVIWTRDESGALTLRVKYSSDNGQTFGTGSSDPGFDLSGTTTSCFAQLIARSTYIHCLFTTDGDSLKHRLIHLDAGLWEPTDILYTGTGLSADFNAAVSADETLGVLFAADDTLLLREYDGVIWGAVQTVTSDAALSPILLYVKTDPYALFSQTVGANQNLLMETHRIGGSFAPPVPVLSQLSPFASCLCYDIGEGEPYADLTSEAASDTGADVFHPVSGALLEDTGDAVYLGAGDRFSLVRAILSTPGQGGTVTWSYWNGADWIAFTPDSGTYHFDSANTAVRLFPDAVSSPADWQKGIVNGQNYYWVRAVTGTAFTTPPVGSQLTAVAESTNVIPLRVS